MQCGHCGTNVPTGYFTCSGCGAVYGKRAGPFSQLVALAALMFTGTTLFLLYDRAYSGAVWHLGAAAFFWLLVWGLSALTPRLWWR